MFPTRFELEAADQLLNDWGVEPAQRIIIEAMLATAEVPPRKEVVQVQLSPIMDSLSQLGTDQDDAEKAIQEMLRPRSVLHSSLTQTFTIVDELTYIERTQEVRFIVNSSFAQIVVEVGELLSQDNPEGARIKYLH